MNDCPLPRFITPEEAIDSRIFYQSYSTSPFLSEETILSLEQAREPGTKAIFISKHEAGMQQ
jgi:hypothetical protein